MIIDLARPEDAVSIARLEQETWDFSWSEAQVCAELESIHGLWLVARQNGGIVGFAGFRILAVSEAELLRIAVATPWRRLGIARRMIDQALAALAQQQVESCYLEVRSANMTARRLYLRMGFVEQGVRPGYYRRPRDSAIIMVRMLNGI